MFLLAHLSDPHLGPLPATRIRDLANKRLLGFVNWHLRRGRQHRRDVLAALVEDLKANVPDHIAVTGDLVNLAMVAEYAPARAWLESLGDPCHVTLVPGNHDVYLRATAGHARHAWDDYMRGDGDAAAGAEFPFVRRRGPLALVGLSTALPTFPLLATGKLGLAQLERLSGILDGLKREGLFRVVLIHHPPAGAGHWQTRLVDAGMLRDVLREHGADLVLHGHDHRHALEWVVGPDGRIPVVGVPSASVAQAGHDDDPAGYHLLRIDGDPGAWRCELVMRGLRRGEPGISELKRLMLTG